MERHIAKNRDEAFEQNFINLSVKQATRFMKSVMQNHAEKN